MMQAFAYRHLVPAKELKVAAWAAQMSSGSRSGKSRKSASAAATAASAESEMQVVSEQPVGENLPWAKIAEVRRVKLA